MARGNRLWCHRMQLLLLLFFYRLTYFGSNPLNGAVVSGEAARMQTRSVTDSLSLTVSIGLKDRVVTAAFDSSHAADVLMQFRQGVTGDPDGVLLNWGNGVVCKWTGVTCDPQSGVVALNLSHQHLIGTISSQLGGLQSLTHVDLSNNSFVGTIPPSLGQLQGLVLLNLSFNSIEGGIPSSISNCSSLTVLDISENLLNSSIPSELGQMVGMIELHLSGNALTGTIPASLSNVSTLKVLELSTNGLMGDLTDFNWGRFGELEVLSLGSNFFEGGIPETLGTLQMLRHIELYDNHLDGTIPASLGNCSNLQYVDMNFNALSGELPVELGMLRRLNYIDLRSNLLSGSVPSSLGNCTGMRILRLSFNHLSGQLPSELGLLSELTELSFEANNLTGIIPSTLGNCSSLTFLNVPHNNLGGAIPKEIFNLPLLTRLYVYFNALNGSIDPSIGNCSALQLFGVRTNGLTGSLPREMGLLKNLQRVTFFQNKMTGRLPAELSNCTSLYDFSIRNNLLTGPIPPELGHLTQLQALKLGENLLDGPIPPQLGNCTQLAYLRLYDNSLTGHIPQELGLLQNLNTLNLSSNFLTGEIPSSLANCVSLYELDLAFNKLTGPIPRVLIRSLLHMQVGLNLSGNHLTGAIPPEIGVLDSVLFIDLSFNNLSGSIPGAFGSCRGLLSLNLSNNNLDGPIPLSIASLPSLHELNVSFNRLTGPVPDVGPFLHFTADSFLGNPALCGPVVRRNCSGSGQSCHGLCWSIPQGGIIILGCGCVLVLSVILMTIWYFCGEGPTLTPTLRDELTGEYKFSVGDILAATEGFSEANVVGLGANSIVYKGVLPGVTIAVKKIDRGERRDLRVASELHREVENLGDLRHRNLLRIYDFCTSPTMEALILEYMPNGSLAKQLYELDKCPLTLDQRLDVAIGVVEALVYLHYECPRPIIHLDLKPSNILLDDNLVPKVSDFGISRFVTDNSIGEASVSTLVHGTIGYIPPEYGVSNHVSTKGDVYSFGVVLLELITRRRPTDKMFGQDACFRQWLTAAFPDKVMEVVDRSLLADALKQTERVQMMLQVGLLCTLDAPNRRPNMKDVRKLLLHTKTVDHVRASCPVWDQLLYDNRTDDNFSLSSSCQHSSSPSTSNFSSTGKTSSTFSIISPS